MNPSDNPAEIERQRANATAKPEKPMSTETDDADSRDAEQPTNEPAESPDVQLDGSAGDMLQTHFEGFDGLVARPFSGTETKVISAGGSAVTGYTVDVQDLSCTCEHGQHNANNAEMCKHVAKALLVMPTFDESSDIHLRDMAALTDRMRSTVERAEAAADALEDARIRELSNRPGNDSDGSADDSGGSVKSDVEQAADAQQDKAEAAAERLKEAFDDTIEAMEVQAHAGVVWFKTGYDTPEDWPFPGGDSTWEVLVKNPDMTEYVGEGGDGYDAHDLYDEKPGEYWKNIIQPEDVDDYISAVLG